MRLDKESIINKEEKIFHLKTFTSNSSLSLNELLLIVNVFFESEFRFSDFSNNSISFIFCFV